MTYLPEQTNEIYTPPPAGYLRISNRDGAHLVRKDAPTLPAMPQMLPDDPTEAAYSAGALRAMMGTDYADNAQVRAVGGAIRAMTIGAVLGLAATMAWAAGYLLLPDVVQLEHLPLAWLAALVLTGVYAMVTEFVAHRYSAAGVERLKIRTAAQMHRDRLESREAMHAAATEAWENVLTKYLDRWEE